MMYPGPPKLKVPICTLRPALSTLHSKAASSASCNVSNHSASAESFSNRLIQNLMAVERRWIVRMKRGRLSPPMLISETNRKDSPPLDRIPQLRYRPQRMVTIPLGRIRSGNPVPTRHLGNLVPRPPWGGRVGNHGRHPTMHRMRGSRKRLKR